jgi:hypothetical protein
VQLKRFAQFLAALVHARPPPQDGFPTLLVLLTVAHESPAVDDGLARGLRKALEGITALRASVSHELPLLQIRSRPSFVAVLRAALDRVPLTTEALQLFQRPKHEFAHFALLVIGARGNPALFPEVKALLRDPRLQRLPPELLPDFAAFLTDRLSECDGELLGSALSAMASIFVQHDGGGALLLALLARADWQAIAANLENVLRALERAVLADPQLFERPGFAVAALRILETGPEVRVFVREFRPILMKLAVSLFHEAAEAREFARTYLERLAGAQPFVEIANGFIAVDKGIGGYTEMAELAVRFVAKKAAATVDEMEELAGIVRPLRIVREGGNVVCAFAKEVERAAEKARRPELDRLIRLIAEFCGSD